jgi:drug/metabolite transporter (DMT)-like permease
MTYIGELASILTAFCWSANSVFFTLAGRRVGSQAVNIVRLWIALLAMVAIHLLLYRSPFPFHAGSAALTWLGLSGLVGFAVGDALLFEAFVRLGPRLSMLVMTLWPVLGALLAWAFLGERMGAAKVAAMAVTLGGIALVVSERASTPDEGKPHHAATGVLLALGGAFCQAVGFLWSKVGMSHGLGPIPANLIRVSAGVMALTLWLGLRGQGLEPFLRMRDRRAFGFIALGGLTGPVLGVILSLVAVAKAQHLGVASTLMSLSPVILLPVSAIFFKERISPRAILGTAITLAGAAGLFLS